MNKLLSNTTVLLFSLFVCLPHTQTDMDTHTLFYCGPNFKALSDYPKMFSKFKKERKKVLYGKTCASLNLIPYSEQLPKLFSRFKKKRKKKLYEETCANLSSF